MSILAANFKHLYQRRTLWFAGLVFGFGTFPVIMTIVGTVTKDMQGGFSAPVLWLFFVGVFIATLPIDVLTKPFSYCLPGHREIPGKFLFSIGLVLSFLWSLSFLFYPELNIAETILATLSAFSVFTISYWLGAWIVFKYRNWSVGFGIFPLVVFGSMFLNMGTIIEHAIVENPLPMILSGGIVNFLAWSYWGRADLARRYCGKLWMGTFDAWNMKKISKLKQVRLAEKDKKKPNSMQISPWVEEFFISRISRAEAGSIQQYIWGALYKSFGLQVSQQRQDWMRFLVLMLPILCFLCYMPGEGGNIIFIMPGLMVIHLNLWVYSSSLICGGRRQRFWSALTLAVTTGILVTVAVMLLAMATHLLEMVMPPLTVKGHEFTYNPFNMNFSLVPFMMIPITLTTGLIFYKKPRLAMLCAIVVFQIFFALSILGKLTIMNWRMQIGLMHIIIMLLISWTLFITTLRYISTRCCLVKQS
ncbi:MAG: hypothetical protein KAS04_03100 [Candidatus Aenigmarchaeota archaeon]|nr:hypothetical protein [Candidatus Aenigmarchaeota archaeon]